MSSSPHALTLLREKPFCLLLVGRVLSSVAYQIGAVCIGWQIYALTHSAYALGLAGLTQFIPMAVLTFAAGHAADRYPRQRVLQMCQVAEAAAASFMAVFTFCHWLTVPEISAPSSSFPARAPSARRRVRRCCRARCRKPIYRAPPLCPPARSRPPPSSARPWAALRMPRCPRCLMP